MKQALGSITAELLFQASVSILLSGPKWNPKMYFDNHQPPTKAIFWKV